MDVDAEKESARKHAHTPHAHIYSYSLSHKKSRTFINVRVYTAPPRYARRYQ